MSVRGLSLMLRRRMRAGATAESRESRLRGKSRGSRLPASAKWCSAPGCALRAGPLKPAMQARSVAVY